MTPPTADSPVAVLHGDSLALLRDMPHAIYDAVITDPPYSSGGFTRSDKAADVSAKYQQSGTARQYAGFSGDNRDTRSWAHWCYLWLAEAQRVTKPGGYLLMFTDWRQLPTATDSVQAGGWLWRGLIAWDKGEGARAPHKGYFRHQCEYVVWATNGPLDVPPVDDPRGGPWAGVVRSPVVQADKHHLTGKPLALMRQLVRCCPPGGLVLDPFAGSGTTGLAAALEGRRAVVIEKEAEYAAITRDRLATALAAAPGYLTAGLSPVGDLFGEPPAEPEAEVVADA